MHVTDMTCLLQSLKAGSVLMLLCRERLASNAGLQQTMKLSVTRAVGLVMFTATFLVFAVILLALTLYSSFHKVSFTQRGIMELCCLSCSNVNLRGLCASAMHVSSRMDD